MNAHIHERKIDAETFERQNQTLRADMDQITLQIRETDRASMDIDATLRFARNLLCDPARFWEMAAPEHRPRLQDAIFPNGLEYDGSLVGTAETSLAFSYLRSAAGEVEGMASPTGGVAPPPRAWVAWSSA